MRIFVKASPGLQLPKEGNPRSYITDSEAVAVDNSHYYQKALIDGDLIELSETEFLAEQAPVAVKASGAGSGKAAAKDAA